MDLFLAEEELLRLLSPAGLLVLWQWLVRDGGAALLGLVLGLLGLVGIEDVTSTPATDMSGTMARATHDRLNILARTSLDRVSVPGHVARSSTACRDNGSLERRSLEVLSLDLGRLGAIDDVPRTTTAGGLEKGRHFRRRCRRR